MANLCAVVCFAVKMINILILCVSEKLYIFALFKF